MKLPRGILTLTDRDRDREILDDMNRVTNIIWQSERKTFKDCELIMEQIITHLFKRGYMK